MASAQDKTNDIFDENKAKIPKETLKIPIENSIRKSKRINKEEPKNTKPTKRSLLKQFSKINVDNEAKIPKETPGCVFTIYFLNCHFHEIFFKLPL